MPGSYLEPTAAVNRRGSDFRLNYVRGAVGRQVGMAFDVVPMPTQFRQSKSVTSS
jgi:hypothetical protein